MKREGWTDLNIKDKAAIVTALAAFLFGWILSIAGFIVEPLGEVADSVLWILGQSLIYCASVFGLTTYFQSETRRLRMYTDERMRLIDKKIEEGENNNDN